MFFIKHLLFLVFFPVFTLSAQTIEWENDLGGSEWDEANDLLQDRDRGYLVVGNVFSSDGDIGTNYGYHDVWCVKLGQNGDLQWEKNFGGSGYDRARSVVKTSDGGSVVAGTSTSSDGDVGGNNGPQDRNDCWVLKLDSTGTLQWEKNFGGSDHDGCNSLVRTSDGGFALAGYSLSSDGDVGWNFGGTDVWVLKLDSVGGLEWEQSLGGYYDEEANSLVQTSDGGFVVAGEGSSPNGHVGGNNGGIDVWLAKLDSSGMFQWGRNYGGDELDMASSIILTSDGGFLVAGESGSSNGDVGGNNGSRDYWVIKLGPTGVLEWEQNYGGSEDDHATSIAQGSDGKFFVVGQSESIDGDVGKNAPHYDHWLLKLDGKGKLLWEENMGGSSEESPSSLVRSKDGGIAIAGYSKSSDGDVGGNKGKTDFWALKYGSSDTGASQASSEGSFVVYPNPTSGEFFIDPGETLKEGKVSIWDIRGRIVRERKFENVDRIRSRITGKAGLYFLELKSKSGKREVRKIVKE